MDGKEKQGDLFIIQLTNKMGMKSFVGEDESGVVMTEKVFARTKFFYNWMAANTYAKKLKKECKVSIVKIKDILGDDPSNIFGSIMETKTVNEMYTIVGYTDDGVKHWIHFDTSNSKYYPVKQKAGACGWFKNKTQTVIDALEADETLSIRKYSAEKFSKQ